MGFMMSMQLNMFDNGFNAKLGQKLRDAGIEQVEYNGQNFVEFMRAVARYFAKTQGEVSSDDLRKFANLNDIAPHHPNAWGAIFRGPQWQMVGFRKSELASNHARRIAVWRYVQ